MVVCGVLGVIIEALAYKPLRRAGSLAVLITAIGVSYFLQNAAQLLFGANPKNFTPVVSGQLTLFGGQLRISFVALLTIVACVVIMVALTLFTGRSKMGKAMRACSEDQGAAQLMGINVNSTISMTFAIGSALAAIAGVLMCSYSPVLQPSNNSTSSPDRIAALTMKSGWMPMERSSRTECWVGLVLTSWAAAM